MRVCAELVGLSAPFVEGIVAGLGAHDTLWYTDNPGAPSPEGARVRYVDESPAAELTLLDAAQLLQAGEGACGSIAAAQFGWLRARQQPAWLLTLRRGATWHVVVKTPRGIWDPTVLAQMRRAV